MAERRRLKVPEWGRLSSSLERSLRDFLPGEISVTVEERKLEPPQEFRVLCLTLKGQRIRKLAAEFGKDESLTLPWLLPTDPHVFVDLADGATDTRWTSAHILSLEGLSRTGGEESAEDSPGASKKEASRIDLPPDLDEGRVYQLWWHDAERLWEQFARSVEANRVNLKAFVRLEAGLNALWVSPRKRHRLLTKIGPSNRENPLLRLEGQRQVRIGLWGVESHGRLRLPHESHRGRLCPFQTPESKRTGLDLQLSAGAEVKSDGSIEPDDDYLFSIAVGMIPYPLHTDGPRLMMGGKNMKQAEIGIEGAEPPIVPGYLEGQRARFIPALKDSLDSDGRLSPPIGLNALTLVMPFEGYTYEDGLVVSKSLARRFFIRNGTHTIRKTYERWIQEPLSNAPDIASAIRGSTPDPEPRYIYGAPLPLPTFDFRERSRSGSLEPCPLPQLLYDHHAPGTLDKDGFHVDVRLSRPSGKENARGIRIALNLTWTFRVERPLGLGDKLTGRNGNKGVVTRILADEAMPEVRIGGREYRAELIISPSSIMGRKNLGQLWEMTHSVLLKSAPKGIPDDDELEGKQKENLSELMRRAGADEWGAFPVSIPTENGHREFRAFAGWQYFCRLHHHALKKLQARGAEGPIQEASGQPAVCGSRTGQRLGEMENWSFLSHGADDVLFKMRAHFTGDFARTRDLMQRIYRSLGLTLDADPNVLRIGRASAAGSFGKGKTAPEPLRSFLKRIRDDGNGDDAGKPVCYKDPDPDGSSHSMEAVLNQQIERLQNAQLKNTEDPTARKRAKSLLEKAQKLKFLLGSQGNLYVDPKLLRLFPGLRTALSEFLHATSKDKQLIAFTRYREQLVALLSGKEGVPRRHLLGRRYNHSARAVIVPCPDLDPHEVRLPLMMLTELLDGYNDERAGDLFSEPLFKVRSRVNDPLHKEWSDEEAKRCDRKLCEEHELWAFLVRQPSLHRHSLQAFRVRCWNEPVIGLPPFVTAGFNADFDGDTMAVFLPHPSSGSLEKFSLPNNPGLVGTGAPALASGLDLALGWWNLDEADRDKWLAQAGLDGSTGKKPKKLEDFLPVLLRHIASRSFPERSSLLGRLQHAVCGASTGAATLSPLEFERLSAHLDKLFPCKKEEEEKDAESAIAAFLREHPDLGLARMVASGAKGKVRDVRHMTWAIGEIDKFEEAPKKPYIRGNFWRGLTEDEMFLYSYPSRDSMAQKKLAVAEAGYLSRQFAEGLFELRVLCEDCRTAKGLEVGYSRIEQEERLTLSLDGETFTLPTLGKLEKDLDRVAWGRTLAGEPARSLSEDDLKAILAFWREGLDISDGELKAHLLANKDRLVLRSPLFCGCPLDEGVCARCCGTDLSQKPLDIPHPVEIGAFVGLTAAQAIGERGTQLAMKRFHDVGGGTQGNKIADLREHFIKKPETQDVKERLGKLLLEVLAIKKSDSRAFKELPQALIHYELALRQSLAQGLDAEASCEEGRYLSALAHERIEHLLFLKEPGRSFTDDFKTIKSRLLWGGSDR